MRVLGGGFIAFVLAANAAFIGLQATFGYDDILREPAGEVLRQYAAGGPTLTLIWLGFTLSALAFAPLALGFHKVARGQWGVELTIATGLGVASAVLQAVGLARWVFVVPGLVTLNATEPAMAQAAFQVIHAYGGVAIGEHLGQLTLLGWTLGAALAMRRAPGRALRLWSWLGLATVPAWLLGQTELLATVIPGAPVIEAAPIAFMAWELWVLGLGVLLLLAAPWSRSQQSV
jgi:hypothetical protein